MKHNPWGWKAKAAMMVGAIGAKFIKDYK